MKSTSNIKPEDILKKYGFDEDVFIEITDMKKAYHQKLVKDLMLEFYHNKVGALDLLDKETDKRQKYKCKLCARIQYDSFACRRCNGPLEPIPLKPEKKEELYSQERIEKIFKEYTPLKEMFEDSNPKHIVMHTSHKGMNNFDVEMVVGVCYNDFDKMAEQYRNAREKLYVKEGELSSFRGHWLVRILIKLKIVKI